MDNSRPEVRYATIFVFPGRAKDEKGTDAPGVSMTPERLTARRGEIVDWTIVDQTGVVKTSRISILWKERSPIDKEPSFKRARFARARVLAEAPPGRYRYSVAIDGKVVFDPELEIMS
jgi:hypothetical protein